MRATGNVFPRNVEDRWQILVKFFAVTNGKTHGKESLPRGLALPCALFTFCRVVFFAVCCRFCLP